MKELTIIYNSFGPLTEVRMDGQPLKVHSAEQVFVEAHCQDPVFSWLGEFVKDILKKYRTALRLSFSGTADDCESFKSLVQDISSHLGDGEVMLGDVKAEMPDPLTTLDSIYKKGKEGPFKEIFNDDQVLQAYKDATSREFEVSFIAAMSSGKSTLMNALLGHNLMPSAAEACTATIVRITDTDSMKGQPFMAVRYDRTGKPIDANPIEVTKEKLTDWNKDKNIPLVKIKGDVPTIAETSSAQYVFQDTPGPNNARDDSHEEMTKKAISERLSMVVYVMTPNTFQGKDNDGIFKHVCREIKKASENARNRFIFVLNKIDEVKTKEESVDSLYKKACEYLESNGIVRPVVIPVCARGALLMRLDRYDKAYFDGNDDDLDELATFRSKFSRPAWNMYSLCKDVLSSSVQVRYEKMLAEASLRSEKDELALLQTGIPLLEMILQEYLYRYALPTKVGDALTCFGRVFDEANKDAVLKELLSGEQEKVCAFAKALNDGEATKERLEKGQQIIEKIRSARYEPSQFSVKELMALSTHYESELDAVVRRLGRGKISPSSANQKGDEARADLDELVADMKDKLTEVLSQEQETKIGALVSEYNKALADSLGSMDVSLRKLQTSILTINAEDIVSTAKREAKGRIKHVRYERHWYTLWCYRHEEVSYEDVVDMEDMARSVRDEMAAYGHKSVEAFKKNVEQSFVDNQKKIVNRMEELQVRLAETAKTSDGASIPHYSGLRECKALQENLDWCDSFRQELSGILKRS